MDFRSTGIGLNGLHLPHFPPPNHPISPSMIYYNLNPSSSSAHSTPLLHNNCTSKMAQSLVNNCQ
uniref:Uncharacterized protein n=1 Tax=Lepeophtheirus salmonis TaxID=72036 RepID=A0A0K2VEZ8_LEPSM